MAWQGLLRACGACCVLLGASMVARAAPPASHPETKAELQAQQKDVDAKLAAAHAQHAALQAELTQLEQQNAVRQRQLQQRDADVAVLQKQLQAAGVQAPASSASASH